ncbi:YrhB domain-containing protein [Streptomyces microflavus]|uniref:YrhB domain-containing protein n=1 Tax=Streptomyces microflavus TaxID=1919 RepID=UPI002E2FE435|nr:YrhB domain-containing protein [Streptomyces microflavus]WSS31969.1 YrhB family protein [Streptomyces microflavus]WST19484.1 YrhB family protein [Streptomyces microflavus]
MISKERAVELVEQALLLEHQEHPLSQEAVPPEVVSGVVRHEFGWLLSTQSRAWLETGDSGHLIVGGGPILVDGEDGSVYLIPIVTFKQDNWQDEYRRRFRGHMTSDAKAPLSARVAQILADEGRLAALRALRQHAPALDLRQALTYVSTLERGDVLTRDLVALSDPEVPPSELPLIQMPGPVLRP